MTHVVWDWNGTLYDDFHVLVEAANVSSRAIGGVTVDAEIFRRHYTRPLTVFYERLTGRTFDESGDEWLAINGHFHAEYERLHRNATLASDALSSLELLNSAGHTQSLLSLWIHKPLIDLVSTLGLSRYFIQVDGLPEVGFARKELLLMDHLEKVAHHFKTNASNIDVVMIGDSVDDADAASAADVRCVLVSSGCASKSDLVATGYPVAETLTEAMKMV